MFVDIADGVEATPSAHAKLWLGERAGWDRARVRSERPEAQGLALPEPVAALRNCLSQATRNPTSLVSPDCRIVVALRARQANDSMMEKAGTVVEALVSSRVSTVSQRAVCRRRRDRDGRRRTVTPPSALRPAARHVLWRCEGSGISARSASRAWRTG